MVPKKNRKKKSRSFYLEKLDSKFGQKNVITTMSGVDMTATSKQQETLDLVRHLETMIIKLNRSFDPLKLKDDNLKCVLLTEILECQRNLLVSNTKKQKPRKLGFNNDLLMTLNEIYDEWKVLAMVVDRICFFIYLTLLIVIISLIYFLTIFS